MQDAPPVLLRLMPALIALKAGFGALQSGGLMAYMTATDPSGSLPYLSDYCVTGRKIPRVSGMGLDGDLPRQRLKSWAKWLFEIFRTRPRPDSRSLYSGTILRPASRGAAPAHRAL